MSYLPTIDNNAESTSPTLKSSSESSVFNLASPHKEAVQTLPTKKIAAVVSKVAVAICTHCGTANTHVARFCASCSTPLIP